METPDLKKIAQEVSELFFGKPQRRTRGRIDYLKLFQLIELDENGKCISDKLFKHEKNLQKVEDAWSKQGKRWKMRIVRFDCQTLIEDTEWFKENPIEDMTEKYFRKYIEQHQ